MRRTIASPRRFPAAGLVAAKELLALAEGIGAIVRDHNANDVVGRSCGLEVDRAAPVMASDGVSTRLMTTRESDLIDAHLGALGKVTPEFDLVKALIEPAHSPTDTSREARSPGTARGAGMRANWEKLVDRP